MSKHLQIILPEAQTLAHWPQKLKFDRPKCVVTKKTIMNFFTSMSYKYVCKPLFL